MSSAILVVTYSYERIYYSSGDSNEDSYDSSSNTRYNPKPSPNPKPTLTLFRARTAYPDMTAVDAVFNERLISVHVEDEARPCCCNVGSFNNRSSKVCTVMVIYCEVVVVMCTGDSTYSDGNGEQQQGCIY